MSVRCLMCLPGEQAKLFVRQDDNDHTGSPKYLCLYHNQFKLIDSVWAEIFEIVDVLIAQAEAREHERCELHH